MRDLSLDWAKIKRIRERTKLKIILKGIMNPKDALIAVDYCDAIYISNHGGSQHFIPVTACPLLVRRWRGTRRTWCVQMPSPWSWLRVCGTASSLCFVRWGRRSWRPGSYPQGWTKEGDDIIRCWERQRHNFAVHRPSNQTMIIISNYGK